MRITIDCTKNERRRILWGIAVFVALATPVFLLAQTSTVLNTFVNGEIADANQVNENFALLTDAVNNSDSRIAALEEAAQRALSLEALRGTYDLINPVIETLLGDRNELTTTNLSAGFSSPGWILNTRNSTPENLDTFIRNSADPNVEYGGIRMQISSFDNSGALSFSFAPTISGGAILSGNSAFNRTSPIVIQFDPTVVDPPSIELQLVLSNAGNRLTFTDISGNVSVYDLAQPVADSIFMEISNANITLTGVFFDGSTEIMQFDILDFMGRTIQVAKVANESLVSNSPFFIRDFAPDGSLVLFDADSRVDDFLRGKAFIDIPTFQRR